MTFLFCKKIIRLLTNRHEKCVFVAYGCVLIWVVILNLLSISKITYNMTGFFQTKMDAKDINKASGVEKVSGLVLKNFTFKFASIFNLLFPFLCYVSQNFPITINNLHFDFITIGKLYLSRELLPSCIKCHNHSNFIVLFWFLRNEITELPKACIYLHYY